jgi:predicted ATPase/class 3 adenylate cyclase
MMSGIAIWSAESNRLSLAERQRAQPTIARTYWFSDVESSTRIWEKHPDAMATALARHDAILRECVETKSGTIVKTTGDGLMAVFERPADAVLAGVRAQRSLQDQSWGETGPLRIRIGMHAGEAQLRGGDYFGPAVNRTARIMAAGHGGQILLSGSVAEAIGGLLPSDVQLRDLGQHRLKDLAEPVRLYQVAASGLPDTFPPLATLDQRPNNLPTQVSEFLGRHAELRALRALIDGKTRLLTLIGPGGTGKTRLALQAAAEQIDRFDDGLFFVSLAPERDPNGVFSAIARAIGLEGSGDAPPIEALKAGLAGKRMLLLLDNFEQAIDAAPALAELLAACAGITAMVTSREALNVRGEQVFAVPALSLPPLAATAPTAETALQSEAVRLFVERAAESRPDFTITNDNVSAIVSICRRVDGLPLAIELAAARLKIFSAAELDERLKGRLDLLRDGPRDLPDRHRALRNTIAWSYELLNPDERLLFEALAVFSGARVDDVEGVTAAIDAFSAVDVIGGVQSLVDKSLLKSVDTAAGGKRWFSMLETIRDYANERLNERREAGGEIRRRHAEYFAGMARDLRPALAGPERKTLLAELSQELGNLHGAWRHWLGASDVVRLYELLDTLWVLHDASGWYRGIVDLADDLLGALSMKPESAELMREKIALQMSVARALVSMRGYTAEVEAAFTKAMKMSGATGELPRQFPVLRSLASLYTLRGEFEKSKEIGRELLAMADRQEDKSLQVDANVVAGMATASSESIDLGLRHLDKAIALFDPKTAGSRRLQLGPNPGIISLTSSALLLWLTGFPVRAAERAARAERISRELDHPSTRAYALHHVALLDLFRQDMRSVGERAAELLKVANANDYPVWRALALLMQGLARMSFGESKEGLAQVEHAMVLYKGETTPPVFWPLVLHLLATAYGMAGRVKEGLARVEEALSFLPPDDWMRCGLTITRADLLTALPGAPTDEAIALYEQTVRLTQQHGLRMVELRAATRLLRLQRSAGAEAGARNALNAVYGSFTEGLDTPDLLAARAALDMH